MTQEEDRAYEEADTEIFPRIPRGKDGMCKSPLEEINEELQREGLPVINPVTDKKESA